MADAASLADAEAVARFERERARFEPRDDDIFVVTYPRSGTTWTLYLAHLLRSGGDDAFAYLSDVAPWYERDLALGKRSADDLNRMGAPRLFKSHGLPTMLPRRGRFLYVTRDGRDVALSYFHLYRAYLGFEGSFERFFARFLAGDLQYGSWFAHVDGWRREEERALLSLRFEDMVAAPREPIRRAAAFLAIDLSPGEEERLCDLIAFARMKEQEARFDFAREARAEGRRLLAAKRFLRSGRVGEGREELSAAQQRAFEQAAQAPARAFRWERDLASFLR